VITADNNRIESNYIGVNAAGDARIDNGFGVSVGGSANVLHGKVISGNFSDGIDTNGSGITITANRIGTNASGTAAVGNGAYGIRAFNATNMVIGSAGVGNIISGNGNDGIYLTTSDDAVIQGNLIGLNATGTAAIGNLMGIQDISQRARIGGTGIGDGNVISGNASTGLYVQGDNTTVEGNFIGTNAAGTASVPNLQGGIVLSGGANNVIGGGAPRAGNVISGNVAEGVYISSPGLPPAFNTSVIANLIGTNAAGTLALPNTQSGLALINSATFSIWNNVISGNGGRGMLVFGSSDISIAGNTIGTNAAGNAALPNLNGIYLFNSSNISVNGNIISGNTQAGIQTDGNTSDVSIRANKIGTDFIAVGFIPNGSGGIVAAGSSANMRIGVLGQENVIAGNIGAGVEVNGLASTIMIGPDAIYSNTGLPIDLAGDGPTANDAGDGDGGPNQRQNFPVFTGPGPGGFVNYTLDSAADQDFTLFFYTSSPAVNDMGTFLGSVVVHTDLVGHFAGTFFTGSGVWVTTTATDASGNTSELSARFFVP
jgi:parallel beta-helix repeat protein